MGFLYVAMGGAVGACLRYAMSLWLGGGLLPWATLATNITGSFVIGLVWGLCAGDEWFQNWGRLVLVVGLLGGFTTFSSFSIDTLNLINAGEYIKAGTYILLSLVLTLSFVFVGFLIGKSL